VAGGSVLTVWKTVTEPFMVKSASSTVIDTMPEKLCAASFHGRDDGS
jgi:hypothetical protein